MRILFYSQDSKSLKDAAKSVSHKLKIGSKSNLSTIEEKEQKKAEKEQKKLEKEQRKAEKKLRKSGGGGSSANLSGSKFDLESSASMFSKVGDSSSSSRKNRDPGVQSDDDDDDMFKLDAISHRSSGSSLNVAGGSGLTNNRNSSDALFRQSFGTPVNPRRSNPDAASIGSTGTPRSSRSFNIDAGAGNKRNSDNVLDEWEAKLLGKKDPGKKEMTFYDRFSQRTTDNDIALTLSNLIAKKSSHFRGRSKL